MARNKKSKSAKNVEKSEKVEKSVTPRYDSDSDVNTDSYSVISDTTGDMSQMADNGGAIEISEPSSLDALFVVNLDKIDALRDAIDNLSAERKDVKTKALTTVKKYLTNYACIDIILKNIETVIVSLLRIIRDKKDLSNLAYSVLEIVIITFGYQNPIVLELCKDILLLLCKDMANNPIRSGAIHCLSILAFVCDISVDEYEKIQEFFYSIMISKTDDSVKIASINAFVLLNTVLSTQYICNHHMSEVISFFIKTLNNENNINIQTAAGQGLVFYIDLPNHVESMNIVIPKADMNEAKAAIHDIISNRYRGLTRDLIVQHRALFRQFAMTIDASNSRETENPSLVFKTHDVTINLSSWKEIIQFNTLRDVLQSGLFVFINNDTIITDIFSDCITKNESHIYSSQEKQYRAKSRLAYEDDIKASEKVKQTYLSSEFYE